MAHVNADRCPKHNRWRFNGICIACRRERRDGESPLEHAKRQHQPPVDVDELVGLVRERKSEPPAEQSSGMPKGGEL